ncbi:MAG: HNH endonuclease [Candidatus Sulfotelmatobacter sp.]
MQIKDLPLPVNVAKADWLAGTRWLGFTPTDASGSAREQCRATINSQVNGGYVIEYITQKFGEPNPGFETDPRYVEERQAHGDVAGRLIAVHRLRPTSRKLAEVLGEKEFSRLQDMWAESNKRYRWSVAFPIIESFSIISPPYANDVFTIAAMKRLFAHPSATLRTLNDEERSQIADLAIEPRPTANAWIGIADEMVMAVQSEINPQTQRLIDQDLNVSAMEGLTEKQKAMVRKRAAWLADRFIREKDRAGELVCESCGFDPVSRISGTAVKARSLLDVHHINPLDEGVRYTTLSDFCLLCPLCHRFAHALARSMKTPAEKAVALRPRPGLRSGIETATGVGS